MENRDLPEQPTSDTLAGSVAAAAASLRDAASTARGELSTRAGLILADEVDAVLAVFERAGVELAELEQRNDELTAELALARTRLVEASASLATEHAMRTARD